MQRHLIIRQLRGFRGGCSLCVETLRVLFLPRHLSLGGSHGQRHRCFCPGCSTCSSKGPGMGSAGGVLHSPPAITEPAPDSLLQGTRELFYLSPACETRGQWRVRGAAHFSRPWPTRERVPDKTADENSSSCKRNKRELEREQNLHPAPPQCALVWDSDRTEAPPTPI